MKDMGMNKVIFDKDNTLTFNHGTKFLSVKVKHAFKFAKSIFGNKNIIILSEMN